MTVIDLKHILRLANDNANVKLINPYDDETHLIKDVVWDEPSPGKPYGEVRIVCETRSMSI